jgi:1-acyl-sn-glycerol-3-phosphate acyltransferase
MRGLGIIYVCSGLGSTLVSPLLTTLFFEGWGIYFMRNVRLKRNWMRDQKRINATFKDMHELIDTGIPVWLGVYPEGTRITKHKLEESRKFAAERNLPVLDKVIIPRTKVRVNTKVANRH